MLQFEKPPFPTVRDAEGKKYCVVTAVFDSNSNNHYVIFTDGNKKEGKYVSLIRRFDSNPEVSELFETTEDEFLIIKDFVERSKSEKN